MTAIIMVGDCREKLREIPDGTMHTCVSSPPYFGLRDYGHPDQIGAEVTPGDFVDAMVAVFREVRRALRDDGTLWLNLGDSYVRNAAKGGSGPGGKNRAYMGDSVGVAQSAKRGSSDGAVGTTAKAAHLWERDPHDWYVEPTRATAQLLSRETFPGWTHDPCCGQGNIVTTLAAAGLVATGSDLVQRVVAPWHMGLADFLDPAGPGLYGADNCVFNPPFYRAVGMEACIRRALELAPGYVAAFCDARFLQGSARAKGLWQDHPPSRIWTITPRLSCPPGTFLQNGGKAGNGSSDWLWLVWDPRGMRDAPGATVEYGWLT